MEIKSTREIMEIEVQTTIDEELGFDSIEIIPSDKKWIALNDLIKMLKEWNCRGNKDKQKTINTILLRIEKK